MTDDDRRVWVYGVVPADAVLEEIERRGDRLPEVRIVQTGDLGAIVGAAPEDDEKATRDQALAHAHVLEAAIVDAPVVPFRFGVMADNDEEVGTELLQGHHDQLVELLRRVEDRVQLTLKAYYREDSVLQEILDREPAIARLREEIRGAPKEATRNQRVKLGELISAAVEQRRQQDVAQIVEAVKPVSIAGVDAGIERELMVLNAPLLVERDRQQELEDAIEELAQERRERLQFRLLGPMPAYDFIDVEEPAWA